MPVVVKARPSMRVVVLESPLRGDYVSNISYARRCLQDSMKRGEAPIAGHLLYTQVLDDLLPNERELGINLHLTHIPRADALVVYEDRGISDGMAQAIAEASRLGVPIEYRRLDAPGGGT